MDLFQRLFEAFKIKKGSQKVLIDDKLPTSFHKANFQEVYQFLNDVKTVNKTRKDRIEDVDRMAFDSIIASAMELITDDVCQEDPITEKCVWVSSEDPNTVKLIMDFLDAIDIEQMLAYMTYNIVRYGEIYYKTYYSEFADNKMPEEYSSMRGYMFEPVVKDYNIADIHKYGSPIGFAKIDEESGTSVLYPVNDYIHVYNNRLNKFDKITLEFSSNGEKTSEEFNMVYGSPLFESAMQAWRMLDLIEALLIYVRFGRSGFYRLVKVDVGGVPTSEATNILTNLKQVFSQQDNINIVEQTYSGSRKPIPHGENLIVPISQGKGDVTVEQVGGESDIKEVVDLEYWRNKLFAALKMPKAYLGFEECLKGDTKITLMNGKTHTIQYMAEHQDEFIGQDILSCNADGEIVPTKINHVHKTRKNANFVRVHLDNDTYVDATPDHLFMMRDGSFKEAGDLQPYDVLMSNASDFNVKVLYVEPLDIVEDAYDLGVDNESHTFLLSCGIFVHNCMPGSLGNTTLTRQDIRYARSVKAVKKVVKGGIQQIIDSHLKAIGKEFLIGQYKVCMTKIMSAETSDIEENMSTNISLAESLRSLLQDARIIDQDELVKFIINEILKLGDKAQDLFLTEEEMAEQIDEEQEFDDSGFGGHNFDDFGGGSDFGGSDFGGGDFGGGSDFGGSDFEAPADFGTSDFESSTPEASPESTM